MWPFKLYLNNLKTFVLPKLARHTFLPFIDKVMHNRTRLLPLHEDLSNTKGLMQNYCNLFYKVVAKVLL